MGQHDYFNGLKRFASKEQKFQQNKLLQNLDPAKLGGGEELNAEMLAAAKDGACLPLALHWLKNPKTFKGNGEKPIIYGVQSQHIASTSFTKNFGRYRGLEDHIEHAGFDTYAGCTVNPGDTSLKGYVSSWLNNDVRNHSRALIPLSFSGRFSGDHGVAVSKKPGKRMEFFDANVGWYKVNEGEETDFCEAFVEGYSNLGIELSGIDMILLATVPHGVRKLFSRE